MKLIVILVTEFFSQSKSIVCHLATDVLCGWSLKTKNIMLCRTCKCVILKGKVPNIAAAGNSLVVCDPPYQSSVLNKLEKKLLSKIQAFTTMVLRPGGQYAEKGLILNLPMNLHNIMGQIQNACSMPFCVVDFEGVKDRKPQTPISSDQPLYMMLISGFVKRTRSTNSVVWTVMIHFQYWLVYLQIARAVILN